MTLICWKPLRYVINGFHVLEMAEISGKWVRNMIDGFRVLKMS